MKMFSQWVLPLFIHCVGLTLVPSWNMPLEPRDVCWTEKRKKKKPCSKHLRRMISVRCSKLDSIRYSGTFVCHSKIIWQKYVAGTFPKPTILFYLFFLVEWPNPPFSPHPPLTWSHTLGLMDSCQVWYTCWQEGAHFKLQIFDLL